MAEIKRSPFEKVNMEGITQEQKKKLANPNYRLEKSPEEKEYMVVFKNRERTLYSNIQNYELDDPDKTEIDGEVIIRTGRHSMFNAIKNYLDIDDNYETDIRNSFVLVDGVGLDKRISLYRFIQLCNGAYKIEYNVDDYLYEHEEDSEEEEIQATGNGYNNTSTLLNED